MANSRGPNFTRDEDIHLCHKYIEIAQDPEIGIYQKNNQFWNRVTLAYNSTKPNSSMQDRTFRSIDTRMHLILAHISAFKGCVSQVEYENPSGASEQDIITRAKKLMTDTPKFSKGFKFEHVWDIMKNFEKFDCTSQHRAEKFSSQSDSPISQSPISPDGLSSFSINLSDDSGSGSASQRPHGVKKAKMKRKKSEDVSVVMGSLKEHNQKINELFDSSAASREYDRQIQMQKIEAKKKATEAKNRMADEYRWEADNKILMIDTESILNPVRRLYFEQEQARILSKRQELLNQPTPPNDAFDSGSYFPDLGGSGSGTGLGNY